MRFIIPTGPQQMYIVQAAQMSPANALTPAVAYMFLATSWEKWPKCMFEIRPRKVAAPKHQVT